MEQINNPALSRNIESTFTSLRKLELNPVLNPDNTISFDFESEHFYIKFKDSEVEIWDFEWLVVDKGGEEVDVFLEAVRYTNGKRLPTITMSYPDENGRMTISTVYRFINYYTEGYPNILLGILNSFFEIKSLLSLVYADIISRKELGKYSDWELPKIGFEKGSNLQLNLSFYLAKIKTEEISVTEEASSEREMHESESGNEEPVISEELIQKYSPERDIKGAIKHWLDYLVKLGCQPVDMSDRSMIMLHYLGHIFSIYFEDDKVTIRHHNTFHFKRKDVREYYSFQKAVMRPVTTPGPKYIVFDPDENGLSSVDALYFLFSDFDFEEKNEFKNLKALKEIMDSFIRAHNNLLFNAHHIHEHLLAKNHMN